MSTIPKDPMILLSYLNTQLRDHYPSLEELCKAFQLDRTEVEQKLLTIDYHYNDTCNQFV